MVKQSQLSVKTMMIYGLILFVVLSIIGVLLFFNIIDLGNYLPSTCNLGSGDVKCEEMQYIGNANRGDIRLGIKNNGQKPIVLLNVTVKDAKGIHFVGSKIGNGEYNLDEINRTHTLPAGEIASVEMDVGKGIPGQVFRGTLKTTYKYEDSGLEKVASGNIRLKVSES